MTKTSAPWLLTLLLLAACGGGGGGGTSPVASTAGETPAPPATAEAAYPAAFDTASGSIHDVASKAYARTRRSMYVLTAADFG